MVKGNNYPLREAQRITPTILTEEACAEGCTTLRHEDKRPWRSWRSALMLAQCSHLPAS